jgi:RimJ/RimL family protein N-acetyltransferase
LATRAPDRAREDVLLRDVAAGDLPVFYEQQLDPDANQMAAFTARDPADRQAFMAHWNRMLGDAAVTTKTILLGEQVAGHVASFDRLGKREVSYWIGKAYWGKGIATHALSVFLGEETTRPLHARCAKDNIASLRVLEKCGFSITGDGRCFSNARGVEVEEYVLKLD